MPRVINLSDFTNYEEVSNRAKQIILRAVPWGLKTCCGYTDEEIDNKPFSLIEQRFQAESKNANGALRVFGFGFWVVLNRCGAFPICVTRSMTEVLSEVLNLSIDILETMETSELFKTFAVIFYTEYFKLLNAELKNSQASIND